jgi:hypothetical protein
MSRGSNAPSRSTRDGLANRDIRSNLHESQPVAVTLYHPSHSPLSVAFSYAKIIISGVVNLFLRMATHRQYEFICFIFDDFEIDFLCKRGDIHSPLLDMTVTISAPCLLKFVQSIESTRISALKHENGSWYAALANESIRV